ncbi:hypothetical protein PFISCL1PPCAC_133, partial [Pristionchus fissidentatus]
ERYVHESMDLLRTRLFQSIRYLMKKRTQRQALYFYKCVINFYSSATRHDEILLDNMSDDEKEIITLFAHDTRLFKVVFNTCSVRDLEKLRIFLSGLVYYRIEIHYFLITFSTRQTLKKLYYDILSTLVKLESQLQLEIDYQIQRGVWPESANGAKNVSHPADHPWFKEGYVSNYRHVEPDHELYDAEYLLTD